MEGSLVHLAGVVGAGEAVRATQPGHIEHQDALANLKSTVVAVHGGGAVETGQHERFDASLTLALCVAQPSMGRRDERAHLRGIERAHLVHRRLVERGVSPMCCNWSSNVTCQRNSSRNGMAHTTHKS
jgi:hypothetical protein